MKVKIGETIYDSKNEPLMVIISAADKENIGNMAPEATCYASFPDGWGNEDQMRAWMLTPNALGQEPCAAVCARSPAPEC